MIGDRMLVNGKVWTGTGEVEAVAIRGGRVLTAGSIDEVRASLGTGAEEVDVEGRRVIPGLIDSHIHFVRAGLSWDDIVRWDGVTSLAAGLERIRRAAAATPAGTWLRVLGGWHPGHFEEGRGPTVAELNEAAPHHRVYVQLLYEEALLNDAAAAHLPESDPPGGTIERTPDGSPTGRIMGGGAFASILAQIPVADRKAQRASTKALAAELNARGITGVVDPGGFGVGPEVYRTAFDLWRDDELTVRTRLYLVPGGHGTEVEDARQWIRYVQPGFGDDMLRYVGFGEILSFGCHDMEGVRPFTMSHAAKADLREITTMLAEAGWPIHMHAIFDSTISDVFDVWEDVDRQMGLPRTSLAHAEPISPASLERAKALGTGMAIQDRMIWRMADSAALWGDEVAASAPPLRDILDMGIPLAAGTDATVVAEINPWRCIWWLVTGESVDGAPPRAERHRLTMAEAIAAYTSGSAWISLDEDERGRLVPGQAADLAVLSDDVFGEVADLPAVTSDLTLVGGRAVHAAGPFAGI